MKNLYDFGYGLSYSKFSYSNLSTNRKVYESLSDTIRINVELKNTSKVDGYEVVQLYSSDLFAEIADVKDFVTSNEFLLNQVNLNQLIFLYQ